jgi:hypothetical protein
MKYLKLTTILLIATAITFSSCKKDNEDKTPPIVTELEIGLNNSMTFFQGGDVHLEFVATDNEELGYYTVEIHPESDKKISGWEFYQRWDFEPGLKNVLVHQHEMQVPADATTGAYHFHLMVVDKEGNANSIERDVMVEEPAGGAEPEIHIASAPGDHQVFTDGQTISVSGHVHSDEAHLAGMLIAIVKTSDNLADSEVNSSNAIVLMHEHDFEAYEVEFSPSILVGVAFDNNHPDPNEISSWALGDAYMLIKAKDENGNWGFSNHYHIVVNGK